MFRVNGGLTNHAEANNGKQQVRPLVAPDGYWNFDVLNLTSISQTENEGFSIYPNPSNGLVRVAFPVEVETAVLTVSDLFGRTILQENLNGGTTLDLDLSHLTPGMYMMDLVMEQGRSSQRLIIK